MSEAIQARRETPIVWGVSDCALTSADIAQAVCGIDHAAPLRGTYSTERGAMRALRRLGFSSVVEFLDSILPRTSSPQPGDFVVMPHAAIDTTMIYGGPRFAWGVGAVGVERFAIPAGALFWSV